MESPSALPPPDELRDLPLEVLLSMLTSARPLHQTLAEWLRRRRSPGGGAGAGGDVLLRYGRLGAAASPAPIARAVKLRGIK